MFLPHLMKRVMGMGKKRVMGMGKNGINIISSAVGMLMDVMCL